MLLVHKYARIIDPTLYERSASDEERIKLMQKAVECAKINCEEILEALIKAELGTYQHLPDLETKEINYYKECLEHLNSI